ncbi:small ribosomal subunit protein mS39-like isoform X3 [Branchiostoma floridae x Branchiostoma belcheri]
MAAPFQRCACRIVFRYRISRVQRDARDKLAVLKALSTTVKRDPTSVDYNFIDDPYLIPKTTMQYKWFSLAKESGQKAAEFFININPQFFHQELVEPSIEVRVTCSSRRNDGSCV